MSIRTARRHASSHAGCSRALAVCRVAVGLAAMASLAACGAGAAPVSLPHKESSAQAARAAPSAAAKASAQQAVEEAYLAFWPASAQAEKTGNATAAEAVLAAYVAPSYISYMLSKMQTAWAANEVSWGTSVEHIQDVFVTTLSSGEQTAVVKDCQDDSNSGLASSQTPGTLLAGSLGSPEQELYTSLSLINGRWLIEQITFVGDTCTS
jgi:hypothetical protein